jgi:tyrosinase
MTRSRLLQKPAGPVPQWLPTPAPPPDPGGSADLDLADLPPGAGLRVRRDHRELGTADWALLLDAIDDLAADPSPAADAPACYEDFVLSHHRALATPPGLNWGVHAARRGDGRNFLPWHRRLLATFEQRLGEVVGDDAFALPYWNWAEDPEPPKPLSEPADLADWGVERLCGSAGGALPPAGAVTAALAVTDGFLAFSHALEKGPYNAVHQWVGGTFATPFAPADPLFWLHHAFVDKLWAHWAAGAGTGHAPARPEEEFHPNTADLPRTNLRCAVLHGAVGDVLDTAALGYTYA